MIETRGLRKSFTSRQGREKKTVEAVRGVDLDVAEGEIFGFLGPNGAGKTTTLRMLATLIEPDGGDGHHRRRRPAQRPRRGAPPDRLRGAGRQHLGRLHRPRGAGAAGPALRHRQGRRASARAARVLGALPAQRVRRPQVQDLLRRPAPPGRHRARHHPRAQGRLPGRADHRPRPAEPRPHVGRGPPAARRGHDRLHHHALPGRGRRALRPDLHHGQRRDRRRGHAGRRSSARSPATWSASACRRRRPAPPRPLDAAPYVTQAGDPRRRRAALRRRRRHRHPADPARARRAPACRWARSSCTGPASTTCS